MKTFVKWFFIILGVILALSISVAIVGNIREGNDKDETTAIGQPNGTTEPEITGPSIEGLWVFNKMGSLTEEKVTFNVNFTSAGKSFSKIVAGGSSDFDLLYDDTPAICCFAPSEEDFDYVDFGKKQAVSAEFVEFMNTYATKCEVSGRYVLGKGPDYFFGGGNYDINFSYGGENYIGIYETYEREGYIGDPCYLFKHATDSSKDCIIGSLGVLNGTSEIDFGSTSQNVSLDLWKMITQYMTKVS